ncbi:hypothetical protein GUITHDRAFT_140415 [Guillardia theta CCMP2712]|uniref:Uncharacterized protein n=1 Tax=Guillardia theta (strain CCMP2712) TaxID=905079 RepID=L1J5Q4_GUITC|nr:hypothetical protein GUITHDRAFT_140415 [Guillardia theta CCMP2712]EKX43672.1 hypothetical protein GUITHDRAFT_140415 [Guillardia theta CCMP2712]|eukprot:XP_005830652.1 hypothetical protein GUITHDRAFT_140415 [Guillardia theta CCMP2712]
MARILRSNSASDSSLPLDEKEVLRRQVAELRTKNADLQNQLMLATAKANGAQPDDRYRIEQLMAQVEMEKRRSEDNCQQILMLQESLRSLGKDCINNVGGRECQTDYDPRPSLLERFVVDIRWALNQEQIQKLGQEILWEIRARKNEMTALQSQLRIATSLNDALSTQLEEGTARVMDANSSVQSVDNEAEIAIWRDRVRSLEEALQQREEDLKLARSQLDGERVRLQTFIQTFEMRSSDARVTELEGELAAARSQLQALQREVDSHRLR